MRLIDADAMLETLKRKYPQWYTGKPKDNWMHYVCLVYYWAVKEAPTIDAVPRWIPCEERLPEPNVAVLGYAPSFNNIFAVYYDSVCGWMTWDPVYDEPFPSCQGEIVAWMPLPKPYKGERKDDE